MNDIVRRDPRAEWIARNRLHPLHAAMQSAQGGEVRWMGPHGVIRKNPHAVGFVGPNGLQVCREIRRVDNLPILILTAQEDDLDHILGLESGADDYVIKPIEPPVLLARLRALIRRHAPLPASPETLAFGQLNVDRRRREAELDGRSIELTTMEFELLWLLASQAGEILSCDEILNQ
ncbi:response regulator transcription factor, partial [Pseudomonas aeruginosa]|nr:response regulator transcription factor [Pseudomonas aeruginosa]